jgi:hypothetical protein
MCDRFALSRGEVRCEPLDCVPKILRQRRALDPFQTPSSTGRSPSPAPDPKHLRLFSPANIRSTSLAALFKELSFGYDVAQCGLLGSQPAAPLLGAEPFMGCMRVLNLLRSGADGGGAAAVASW